MRMAKVQPIANACAAVALLTLGGCGDRSTVLSPTSDANVGVSWQINALETAGPPRIQVAPGGSITYTPRPLDRARGEVPLPRSLRASEGMSRRAGFRFPPRYKVAANPSDGAPPPGGDGADRGLYLDVSFPAVYGTSVIADAGLDRSLPAALDGSNPVYLFAPTLLPGGGSCIEASIITTRNSGSDTTTYHFFGYYDWCASATGWVDWFPINQTFQNAYVRTADGRPTVTFSVSTVGGYVTPPRCWFVDVYNYTVGGWEQFYSSCGTTNIFTYPQTEGWLMWETYNLVNSSTCPSIQSTRAIDIRLFHADSYGNGSSFPITDYPQYVTQHGANPPYDVALCYGSGAYTFSYPGPSGLPYNSWLAETPNP